MDRLRWGLWALAPAPWVFSARALMEWSGRDPAGVAGLAALTAASGVLSLLGVALLAWRRPTAWPGALLVLVGHFGVAAVLPDVGAGMVYLGTGLLVAPWRAAGLAGGGLALLAAPFRPALGGLLGVASGAAVLGVAVARAALDMRHRG